MPAHIRGYARNRALMRALGAVNARMGAKALTSTAAGTKRS
jgi:hypothetical protein